MTVIQIYFGIGNFTNTGCALISRISFMLTDSSSKSILRLVAVPRLALLGILLEDYQNRAHVLHFWSIDSSCSLEHLSVHHYLRWLSD